MCTFTLIKDGDDLEKTCFPLFLRDEFPSYETFWQQKVVPLTNRPENIYFKSNQDLAAISKGQKDICIAQLNYSVLNHLYAVYRLKNIQRLTLDN
jgi:hypothetical protein